jgi:hypothetical protein
MAAALMGGASDFACADDSGVGVNAQLIESAQIF